MRSFLLLLLLISYSILSCTSYKETGYLTVESLQDGVFDIYKISSSSTILFTAETNGSYNQKITLPVGHYLLLGDCSHDTVIIKPDHHSIKRVHTVSFIPPTEVSSSDLFSIQCSRYEKTHFRQTLSNRFSINLFAGNHQLLVGMVPFSISIDPDQKTSEKREYNLSAIKVEIPENVSNSSPEYKTLSDESSYFLSSRLDMISVTIGQKFGHWTFLLPGDFNLELNGTLKTLHLKEKEALTINPSFIKIQPVIPLDLEQFRIIQGSSPLVEVNDGHWINLDETYPVLPGQLSLKLDNSFTAITVTTEQNELLVKKVNSIQINSDCNLWDWNCLGNRNIYLYEKDSPSYFARSVTDMPTLYFQDSVYVEIEGSKGIKTPVGDKHIINLGRLILKTRYEHIPNLITDLVRIEGGDKERTSDLQSSELSIPMLPGSYHLARYNSIKGSDDRKKSSIPFKILPFNDTELEYTVMVSEKQLHSIQQHEQSRISSKDNMLYSRMRKSYLNSWPLRTY